LKAEERKIKLEREIRFQEVLSSSVSTEDQKTLIERVIGVAQQPIESLDDAISQEEALIAKLNEFIEEVMKMSAAIQDKIDNKDLYSRIEDFASSMQDVEKKTQQAQEQRERDLIDLSQYTKRLAQMGQEVDHLLQAHQEVVQTLLKS